MDMVSFAVSGDSPTALPKQIYMTIHGDAAELALLIQAAEQAIHGGPAVIEVRAANGVPMRVLVDRLGPAQPSN